MVLSADRHPHLHADRYHHLRREWGAVTLPARAGAGRVRRRPGVAAGSTRPPSKMRRDSSAQRRWPRPHQRVKQQRPKRQSTRSHSCVHQLSAGSRFLWRIWDVLHATTSIRTPGARAATGSQRRGHLCVRSSFAAINTPSARTATPMMIPVQFRSVMRLSLTLSPGALSPQWRVASTRPRAERYHRWSAPRPA